MIYSTIEHKLGNKNPSCGMEDYEILKKIGRGQFSTVYKVKNKNGNDIYAMKVIEKRLESQKETQIKELNREIQNLIKCYHWENNYNTVKLFNYFETKEQYILIFNYCDITLEQYVEENYPDKKMPIKDIKLLFLELNNGFKNLYLEKVIHRDIKINNILIEYRFGDKHDFIPRLADFGISRENSTENNPMTNSISWMTLSAPEILSDGSDYSFKSDLWSIGILLYKLAFGKYPYEAPGIVQLYMKIMNGPKKLESSGDKNFDDLISKLLEKDIEKRITYDKYFKHPFFKYNEPESVIQLNKKYDLNISSYNREFRVEGFSYSSILDDVCQVQFVKLRELNLQNCGIKELNSLASMTFKHLIFLNLQYNYISNLAPMKKVYFLNIIEMHFALNQIRDISPLKDVGFKCLKVLGLAGNPIEWNKENKAIISSLISK